MHLCVPKGSRAKYIVQRVVALDLIDSVANSMLSFNVNQRRDGAFGVVQPKTRADGDNFTCFGGRRRVHTCGGRLERIRLLTGTHYLLS
jgi:hypothetical protein